ncbi:hypothetical protein EGR52_11900 [bacterium]|nr:hypothetical protein [bacterium]MBD8924077.1 hypothetical protein [bacterium]
MESKSILEIFKNFEKDNTYKKILINGRWGIGKSFYTNQYIEGKNNAIYISLFGKENIEVIQEEIAKELFKKANSKKKFWKKGKELAKKIKGSISYKGISIKSPEIKAKSVIEEYCSILKEEENLIIVIDDLERKSEKIRIEDILGVIEQLSLCNQIKIVLIGDESRVNEADKKVWKSFKEKIIEKEYKISKFSKEAINSIVISKLKQYINEKELDDFVENFIEKFPIDNLRTINKGVNLFLEILNMYIYKEYPNINLVILKSCMAVAIEKTENLFEPEKEEKNLNYYDTFSRSLDENIETRIERHYFNSSLIINKEAALVHYILAIFEGNQTKKLIDEMNQVIEQYINSKDEKNIFYLNEEKIKNIVNDKYNLIIENQYTYTCLDEFVDDIYNILDWCNALDIKYDESKLKKSFKLVLFENYYKKEKNLYENTIDRFELKYENCEKLRTYVNDYNKDAEEKYYIEKIEMIEKSFQEKEFDVQKLRWIDNAFIQSNKEIQFERFITKARENNYFISDISGEITEKEWKWIHYIWNIFYKYMDKKYKDELQKYVNSLKSINKIQDIRIETLQNYKPLVKLDNNK